MEVVYNSDTSTIVCAFFSKANYSCSIRYGLCSDRNMESLTMSQRSYAIGSDKVLLQIESSGLALYCYAVRASNGTFALIVEGRFDAMSPGV